MRSSHPWIRFQVFQLLCFKSIKYSCKVHVVTLWENLSGFPLAGVMPSQSSWAVRGVIIVSVLTGNLWLWNWFLLTAGWQVTASHAVSFVRATMKILSAGRRSNNHPLLKLNSNSEHFPPVGKWYEDNSVRLFSFRFWAWVHDKIYPHFSTLDSSGMTGQNLKEIRHVIWRHDAHRDTTAGHCLIK